MTATCGHEIDVKWFDSEKSKIAAKSHGRDGSRAISYLVVCRDCRRGVFRRLILKDEEAQRAYLNGAQPSQREGK